MRDKNNEPQGPNLMVSRHGASENLLQTCADCRHLAFYHNFGVAGHSRTCEQFTTPGGHKMPWAAENRACGLFEERVVGP